MQVDKSQSKNKIISAERAMKEKVIQQNSVQKRTKEEKFISLRLSKPIIY